MSTHTHMHPIARKDGIVVKQLEREVLVYDLDRHQAHCLNDTAAKVWKYCDGNFTVGDIAKRLEAELHAPCDEAIVWYALAGLEKKHLLQQRVVPAAAAAKLRRREALRLGLGSLIALPLIASMAAPTPAQAQSCVGAGGHCSSSGQCCPPYSCCSSGPAANTCATLPVCIL